MKGLNLGIADGVAVITLARPEKRNAISLEMWRQLPSLFKQLEDDSRVRGIALTGEGGHFSAGADISEFGEVRADASQAAEYEVAVDQCCDTIFGIRKPTVAAIRGACMGGACNVAMSCDFRFAEQGARFGIPAARLSIVYGVKGTQRLLALVGLSNAKRIFYTADACAADEAFRIGLVDRIAADPLEEAQAFLKRVGKNAPMSIAGAKTLLNGLAMGAGSLDPAVATDVIQGAAGSEDYRESVQAFAEKREPVFRGR